MPSVRNQSTQVLGGNCFDVLNLGRTSVKKNEKKIKSEWNANQLQLKWQNKVSSEGKEKKIQFTLDEQKNSRLKTSTF